MATLTMEQDPDLKRFIEDRKQRYYDNDKAAVFATSLPLSNNGVEDRRSQLRDERHRDYQRYLERFGQQYQKPGDEHIENPFLPPPGAMPKSPAKRQVQQQRMDRKYDQKYDQILKETEQKHQDESERNRTRYSPSRPQAPSQPRLGDIDYSQMKQELADERKRDYQDYLGKKYIAASEHPYKQPIDYKQQRLFLAEERRHEYNEYLNKKGKAEREFALKGRVPTPPGGLDIGQHEQERKALDAARKQEYRELLDKQSQEQLLNRVWDRANETSPAHIGYRKTERPLVGSPREISLYDQRQRQQQQEHMYVRAQQENGIPVLDRTQREDNSYVTSKPPPGPGANRQRDERESERYRPHADELPPPGPSDFPKGHHYSSDEYEKYRKDLQQKQQAEYQDFLQKKQMSDPPRFGRNTPPVVGPYSGIFAGLGQYDLDKQRLKKERQSEYSNYLDKTYAEKGRPYGRPTWAKGIDDNEQYPARPYSYEHQSNPETKPRDHLPPIEGQGQGERRPPSYEDMLAKKRQVEADRRRYDPGFAPRDDRYEAERSGPPRDGDYAPRDGGYGGDGNQGQDRYRY